MNIALALEQCAQCSPERIALVDLDAADGPDRLTYGALYHRVGCFARGLMQRGLQPGDRVALLVANSTEYVEAFMAIAAAGLVAVPLNIRLLEDDLRHMLKDSGARFLIANDHLLQARPGLSALVPDGVIVIGDLTAAHSHGQKPVASFRFSEIPCEPPLPILPVGSEQLMSLMYTSGTTGSPKGVMLSHGSWSAVAAFTIHHLNYGDDEITLHTAPLTHGAGFLVLPTLLRGGTNLVCARFDAARTLDLFAQEGVTNGFFVPSMIRMLLDEAAQRPPRSFPLRSLYYAGSPIDPGTLREALERFGPVLVQSFAQMESPMFLTVLDHDDHRRIASGESEHLLRSAGRPVKGAEVRVVDDGGAPLPVGGTGEIVARAPQVMLGYWQRPDATRDALHEGWLHTGDIGRFDDGGYLYIVDRKKDMIISGGSNVYAREVEDVLLRYPGIAEVAVIGLPHAKWGEMVTAVLVCQPGMTVDEDELADFCREQLADYRRPRRFFYIDVLPRNPYGKVLKRELRERYAQAPR